MSDYLTVAEISDKLRVSKMTVHRLIETGALPALRIGRSYRVDRDDYDTYVAGAKKWRAS